MNIENAQKIYNLLITGEATQIKHKDIGDINLTTGIQGSYEKEYADSYGIDHIIARRIYSGKNYKEIAKLFSDLSELLKDGEIKKVIKNGDLRYEITDKKNNLAIVLNKLYSEKIDNYLLTGYVRKNSGVERLHSPNNYAPNAPLCRQEVGAELLTLIEYEKSKKKSSENKVNESIVWKTKSRRNRNNKDMER